MEIRNVPSWYDREQRPSLTSNQLVFFYGVHLQQVNRPPTKSKLNEHNIRFPRDWEGNIDAKSGKYYTDNQPKNATFKYVVKINSKEGMVTGKWCLVLDYTGEKICTIDQQQKEIQKEFARFWKLTSSSPQWAEKIRTDKVRLYEYVGNLEGVGQQIK